MSWTVFDVMRMREYKLCRSKLFNFHFERTYFALLQHFFVLNFVKKLKVQHGFFSNLTGNKPTVSRISGCSTVKQSLYNNCFDVDVFDHFIVVVPVWAQNKEDIAEA
jgi:hypothetical protein